jgi:hypothetical protein
MSSTRRHRLTAGMSITLWDEEGRGIDMICVTPVDLTQLKEAIWDFEREHRRRERARMQRLKR